MIREPETSGNIVLDRVQVLDERQFEVNARIKSFVVITQPYEMHAPLHALFLMSHNFHMIYNGVLFLLLFLSSNNRLHVNW